ncbi:MAG TPA: hypothetical protein VEW95_05490 [Candidatus Limnocylindrales bacterium]|nr:hypothetical protein [Candidatus Limnocylindrales bacterium]
MTSLYFVTPAWQRFELTAICLEQRRRVIDELAGHGIEAQCVVIADDENLDTARALGFETVERDNEWLGRRFNDGMQHAGYHGADWIVPIGSDSWIDAAYFTPLPRATRTRTSGMYAPVELARLAELRVGRRGAGPYMLHRSLLEPIAFRPAIDEITRRVDSSTVRGIPGPIRWERRDLHPLQYIGFRLPPLITEYDRLWERWGVVERTDPWEQLATVYPIDLVERARQAMEAAA